MLQVFKRYLECKRKALLSYEKECRDQLEVKSSTDVSIIEVEENAMSSSCQVDSSTISPVDVKSKRKRRSGGRVGGRKKRRMSAKRSAVIESESSDEDSSLDKEDTISSQQRDSRKSGGDSSFPRIPGNEGEHDNASVCAAHVPCSWTDMFAPTMAEHLIGNEGNFY